MKPEYECAVLVISWIMLDGGKLKEQINKVMKKIEERKNWEWDYDIDLAIENWENFINFHNWGEWEDKKIYEILKDTDIKYRRIDETCWWCEDCRLI